MEPHIDGNEGPGRPPLLREPILICSGSAGHLRVRRLPGHCLPQNELLQVRGRAIVFHKKAAPDPS